MSDMNRVLASRDKNVVLSVTGKRTLKRECLYFLHKLTLWNSLFPLNFASVLHKLQAIVQDLYRLGVNLSLPRHHLDAIETDFPHSTERRRMELVRVWMSSCWWHLVQALKQMDTEFWQRKLKQSMVSFGE